MVVRLWLEYLDLEVLSSLTNMLMPSELVMKLGSSRSVLPFYSRLFRFFTAVICHG